MVMMVFFFMVFDCVMSNKVDGFLELERSVDLDGERAQVASGHNLVLDVLGLVLGDELGSCYAALGAGLVEEVDHGAAQRETLVDLPVDTAKGLPVAIEIVGLIDVGVGLAEVAEAGPELDILCNHVAWIQFDEYLWYFSDGVASGIDVTYMAIIECHRCLKLLVCRLLISEEEVEIKSLEWVHHSICSPSPGLNIVC